MTADFTLTKGIIQLLTTTVVVGEVSQHIQDDVALFVDTQKKLSKNAASIRNLPEYADVIRRINVEDLNCKTQQAFRNFLTATKCRILSSNGIDNDLLLNDYFSKRLPFENNTQKSSEFKDAFIVYTLRKYAQKNGVSINIVSSDKGFCGAFSDDTRFRIFPRSEELFSYITKFLEAISAQNSEIVQLYINQPDIKHELISRIENEIYNVGVWIEEICEDGDIHLIDVQDIALMYLDDLDNNTLPIHIEAAVTLVVDYTCVDEGNSYWDKEEGVYLFAATSDIRLTKQINLDFNATLKVNADKDGNIHNIIKIGDFDIVDSQSGITIDVDNDDNIEVLRSSLEDDLNSDYAPGAYTTCPDCGCKIDIENDGGNGFCVKCAPNH